MAALDHAAPLAEAQAATRGKYALAAAIAIALVPLVLLATRFWFTCDDAYISFRYARHLVEGRGLVFNAGESPPVEGYSNLLWVLYLAPFQAAGANLALVANLTSLAAAALLVALVALTAARRFGFGFQGTCAIALFVALQPAVVLWSSGGLETMPFALCVFATYACLAGDRAGRWCGLQAGALALSAALLRADGAIFATLAIAAAVIELGWRDAARRRAYLQAAAVLLIGTLAHVVWRHGYYDGWLPNTARIKGSSSVLRLERGAKYLASMCIAMPALPLAVLAALSLRNRLLLGALAFIVPTWAYCVYVGGDFMPFGRYMVASVPFCALLFAAVMCKLARRPLPVRVFALGLLALSPLALFELELAPQRVRQALHFRWNDPEPPSEVEMWRGMRSRADAWALTGRALALATQPGESIILGNIGAIGYFSDLHIHDMFGLVSPEVAKLPATDGRASPGHDRMVSQEFFFPRRPTYLNAWIAKSDTPRESGLPPLWAGWLRGGLVRLEGVPLPTSAGFPPQTELRILRFDWGS